MEARTIQETLWDEDPVNQRMRAIFDLKAQEFQTLFENSEGKYLFVRNGNGQFHLSVDYKTYCKNGAKPISETSNDINLIHSGEFCDTCFVNVICENRNVKYNVKWKCKHIQGCKKTRPRNADYCSSHQN